ncbi:hypothetical protein A6A08_20010 [Nocardiopsis sp. TSRI0078]|uniref:DUF3017 domain-containing protein n=1 Tax=unclassified Nocardiopsis TaxID=2649073 RepID=UPI00093BBCE6|nr:DUF3017 domain-containing protein [Nocardiopsis sp. TSRI0078]OKI21882.1 hypothetical protein A6A08_20010 [Nocardiopsis sp. TSRI0078]
MEKAEQADVADAGEGVPEEREPEGAARDGHGDDAGRAERDGDPDGAAQDTDAGGSPARPEVPYWLSQVPYFLVMSALAAGIVVVAAAHFKRGPAIIAGALLLAASFRLFLPKDWIGMLAVRRRWIDLLTLVTLAVLLIVLAWVAPQLSS